MDGTEIYIEELDNRLDVDKSAQCYFGTSSWPFQYPLTPNVPMLIKRKPTLRDCDRFVLSSSSPRRPKRDPKCIRTIDNKPSASGVEVHQSQDRTTAHISGNHIGGNGTAQSIVPDVVRPHRNICEIVRYVKCVLKRQCCQEVAYSGGP